MTKDGSPISRNRGAVEVLPGSGQPMIWAGHELPIMFKGAVQVNNTYRYQPHEGACEKVKIKHPKRLE